MKRGIAGDRLFAGIAILLISGYGYFAFFEISAPIQYDPLGPEGWPRFLATVAFLLCIALLRNPEEHDSAVSGSVAKRVLVAAAMLAGYAFLFEWLGFALATALFCIGIARLLGASRSRAVVFGLITGIGLYAVAVYLLGLNLPIGDVIAMAVDAQ